MHAPSEVLRALLTSGNDAVRRTVTAFVGEHQHDASLGAQQLHYQQQHQQAEQQNQRQQQQPSAGQSQHQHQYQHHNQPHYDGVAMRNSAFFWNESFQEILAAPDDLAKFRRLRNLAHDFTHAASVYGRIIISERFLPVADKTIKPLSLGGTAGGLKYIAGGVMFKFAVDVKLSNNAWMYGGAQPSDERAMKTGGHEIKAVINLLSLSPKDSQRVHFPMMAVVDYRGFRLLAEALLPIDNSTCIYGSPDG